MAPDPGTTTTTVTCPRCTGTTIVVDPCRCRDGNGGFLVDQSNVGHSNAGQSEATGMGRPWPDCELCGGDGAVAGPCRECHGYGRLRAQLVLTVANLDSGAVASASVVPGSVPPTVAPGGSGWQIALGPVLADLATRVDAAPPTLREVFTPERPPAPDGELSIPLPYDWRPDLPAADRHRIEAAALANRSYAPWLVFVGHGAVTEAGNCLDRLCRLAERLCLDLVVEVRADCSTALTWDIRFETSGAAVPDRPHGQHPDLATAVRHTTVADAFDNLAERCRTAPAHFLHPPPPVAVAIHAEPTDLDQLERRIVGDCGDGAGAQAIWRNGRWWHTRLRTGERGTSFRVLDTGQVAHRSTASLLRTWEPPAPGWRGEPIPYLACDACGGRGTREWFLGCHGCGGTGRRYQGLVLTVTDLERRVVHLNWRPDDGTGPTTLVATQPAGQPVVQLAGGHRLRTWADNFGVRPDELTDPETGHTLDQDLLDGIVTLSDPHGNPVTAYLAAAGRGRPAGRVIVAAVPRDAPPLADLVRLVHGLGLAVQVTVADYQHNAGDPRLVHGVHWQVEVVDPDSPLGPASPPLRQSLPEAVGYCLRFLGPALLATVPVDPDHPLRVPQQPVPPAEPPDPTDHLRQLAARHPGEPVVARLDPRCRRSRATE
ncbi:hypothetical protein V1633_12385 [Plantactinospora sonchi]|uniref:Uncharacterized protein n=2 Tax=Plantactinospora sonchi TaxID=1544735 RepID=A0ABU7RS14_9ACTN